MIIASSPRKNGNSDLLAEQFAKGAQEAGNKVETVWLRELKLNYCLGCYTCQRKGACVFKDGMETLLQKMTDADVIVLATPVYFYSVSGQMKVFFDRTLPVYGKMTNKQLYFMVTAQDDHKAQLDRAFDAMQGWADCFDGMEVKGKVYGGNTFEKGDVKDRPAFEEAYQLGKSVK